MGTHKLNKEQASNRTNKDRREYVTGQKNKHLGKRKDDGLRRN